VELTQRGIEGVTDRLKDVDLPTNWFKRDGKDGADTEIGTPLSIKIGYT